MADNEGHIKPENTTLKEPDVTYAYSQLDILKLPETARQELLDFYEFLLKKTQK